MNTGNKVCKDCQQLLPLSDFRKKRKGYEVRCKPCRNTRYNKSTPQRVFRKIYESQCRHSDSRGHPPPAYNFEQLKAWVDRQSNAHDLWDAYVASNYDSTLKPSVDRLDDSKPYTLCNIQLTTWGFNRQKGNESKKKGEMKSARPVVALNLDGTLHKKYSTVSEALRDIQGKYWGIATVANGTPVKDGRGSYYTPATYKGFKWQWTT